jgi:hypothetical protein
MCETPCCSSSPISQTENPQPASCAPCVREVLQESTPYPYPEWASGCCGNVTVLVVDSAVLQDQSKWAVTEDELGRQYLGEWWDGPIIETRPSFLRRLWNGLVKLTT